MFPTQHPHASVNNLQTGARVALFGMLVNLIFAAAKILGGLFGHAYVLIAGLIIVATIVTIAAFGTKVFAKWTSVNASM